MQGTMEWTLGNILQYVVLATLGGLPLGLLFHWLNLRRGTIRVYFLYSLRLCNVNLDKFPRLSLKLNDKDISGSLFYIEFVITNNSRLSVSAQQQQGAFLAFELPDPYTWVECILRETPDVNSNSEINDAHKNQLKIYWKLLGHRDAIRCHAIIRDESAADAGSVPKSHGVFKKPKWFKKIQISQRIPNIPPRVFRKKWTGPEHMISIGWKLVYILIAWLLYTALIPAFDMMVARFEHNPPNYYARVLEDGSTDTLVGVAYLPAYSSSPDSVIAYSIHDPGTILVIPMRETSRLSPSEAGRSFISILGLAIISVLVASVLCGLLCAMVWSIPRSIILTIRLRRLFRRTAT